MIRHIRAESVNQALSEGLYHLAYHGIEEPSRNGPVIVSPCPVITTYVRPERRVLVSATRDANPFFHLFEALWMLAGRNDVTFPATFASNIASYSDDGETLHGAYGYRWREAFGFDQLPVIIRELKNNPASRRCVLQMWDPTPRYDDRGGDGGADDLRLAMEGGLDVPCNTAAYFDTIGGKLNMTVTCRSNDIIWGAYGANAVHFSILLEYVAALTGIPMGVYRQFSNNFHAYTNLVPRSQFGSYADSVAATCVYSSAGAMRTRTFDKTPFLVPLMEPGDDAWHEDLERFMTMVDAGGLVASTYTTNFFTKVVGPMFQTWYLWKHKDFDGAWQASLTIAADDWRLAAQDWLSIREQRRLEKTNV